MDNINGLINAATDKALKNKQNQPTDNQTGIYAQALKHIILKNLTQGVSQLTGQLKIAISAFVVSLFALVWFFSLGELEPEGMAILSTWCTGSATYTIYLARKKSSAAPSAESIR